MLAIGLAVFGFVMWRNASLQAQKAQSLTLAAFAREQLDKDLTRAIRLAELAWKTYPSASKPLPVERIVAEEFYGPVNSYQFFYENSIIHTGLVCRAVFSPDGKKIVTASEDKTAKI